MTKKNPTHQADKAGEHAKKAAQGFFENTKAALQSPTAKEVYKATGWVALGAVVTALTGFRIPTS